MVFAFDLSRQINKAHINISYDVREVLKELSILVNAFSFEIVKVIEKALNNGLIIIKVPSIITDLTRDVDALPSNKNSISLEVVKSPTFGIILDIYSWKGILNQSCFCANRLREIFEQKPVLCEREVKVLKINSDFEVEIDKIKVSGLNPFIDFCIIVGNIINNDFLTYYDILNFVSYIRVLRNEDISKVFERHIKAIPIFPYPKPLYMKPSKPYLIRLVKYITDNNYTPAYGDMISFVRKAASKLKLSKLLEVLS